MKVTGLIGSVLFLMVVTGIRMRDNPLFTDKEEREAFVKKYAPKQAARKSQYRRTEIR